MHNWKWVNLIKMTGFNISLRLNKRQSSSDKSTTKAYVSFCFSLSAVLSSALYRFLYRQWNKRNYSTPFPNCFHFFSEKNSLSKTFLVECVRSGAASCNKRREFWRETRTPCGFWLDVSFFSHVKKHRSRFWLDVSFFSRVKTIVRSSDWLELICVRKFTT